MRNYQAWFVWLRTTKYQLFKFVLQLTFKLVGNHTVGPYAYNAIWTTIYEMR